MGDRGNRDYSAAVRGATTVVFPPLIRALMKRDWRGHEHIPREGPVIVAANHLSYADWAAVALFVYEAGRYPAFLIKSSAFNVRVVGPFLRGAGQFPVNRGQADAALVLRDAERALAHEECLIFYPEGTATRDPALWPMVPKTGVARLALATGAPVIPVAHWGAQVILPYGSKRPSLLPRHLVRMLAGPPVDLTAFAGEPLSRNVLRAAAAAIMADIAGLLATLRGEAPPARPYDPVAARRASRQVTEQVMPNGPGVAGHAPAGERGAVPELPGKRGAPAEVAGGERLAPEVPGGDEPTEAAPA